ncbi:Ribosome-binding factor A [Nymphon striatum]|nr:Ribosome-binding factor A [Nymphon striatum]
MIRAPSRLGPWKIKRLAWFALVLVNLIAGLFLVLFSIARNTEIPSVAYYAIGIAIAIIVFDVFLMPLYYRWYFNRLNMHNAEATIIFDASGIDSKQDGLQSKVEWNKITRIEETADHIFFWLSSLQAWNAQMSKANEPSQRQLRVGENVRHALTQLIQRGEVQDPVLDGVVISVSEVQMSPDLKIATAFVTAFGQKDMQPIVKALAANAKFIRGRVTPALREMKYMPSFRFRPDTSFDNFSKIDALLKSPEVARDLDDEENGTEE